MHDLIAVLVIFVIAVYFGRRSDRKREEENERITQAKIRHALKERDKREQK